MKLKTNLLMTGVLLSCFSQTSIADFTTTVTLNSVTNTYTFPDAESALTVNQLDYRDDFKNPVTGTLPNTDTGQITQFSFDNTPLTTIKTSFNTLLIAPVPGISTDFITLTKSSSNGSLNSQLVSLLSSGIIPPGATLGLSSTALTALNNLIATIPPSNQTLANTLNQYIAQANSSNTTDLNTISQALLEKLASAKNTLIRDDATLARYHPTASIAGNPASLMGTMVDQIFLQTTDYEKNGRTRPRPFAASSDQKKGNFFAVGLQYGHYNLAGTSVDTVTAPLTYRAKFNATNELIVSVPLTYVNTQGNASYQGGVGLAYKYNLLDNWSLTPAVNYAYRGTPNSGDGLNRTEGHIIAGTLTSKFLWDLDPENTKSFKITFNNMVGYFQTLNMSTTIGRTSYQTSGNVANVVLKNGLSLSKTIGKINVAAFATDTEYFQSKLYYEQYNEAGIAIRPDHAGRTWDSLSMSANYLFSVAKGQQGNLDGFRLNLSYQF